MNAPIAEDNLLIEKLRKRYEGKSAQEVRDDLRAKYTETWTDAELLEQFEVRQFDGPTVQVIRKSDGKTGTVGYISEPRVYFAFIESDYE